MTRRSVTALGVPLALLVVLAGAQPRATSGAAARAGTAADRRAVAQAVADYVDALYQVDPARVERSVHPSLSNAGFSRTPAGYEASRMTYEELRALAARWNARKRLDVARAPREVVVLDVLDQTASAKLVAQWGVDYLHLARYDGR